MAVDGRDHALGRHVQLLRGRVHDADVRLMRNQPVDRGGFEPVHGQRFLRDLREDLHRELEHRIAFHGQERRAAHCAVRDRPRHCENIAIVTIGVQVHRQDARFLRGRQHHRSGTVAEQHAGPAVVPVEDTGIDLGADDQCVPCLAGLDHEVGQPQPVDEAAAHGLNIERRTVPRAELVLKDARRRGKHHVRRGRRNHDEIDVGRRDLRRGKRLARGVKREIARLLGGRRDVPLPDAGSGANPFVARIDALGKLVVGEDLCREIAAGARDPTMHRRDLPQPQRPALSLPGSRRAAARCVRARRASPRCTPF